jgi:hypothetical protein
VAHSDEAQSATGNESLQSGDQVPSSGGLKVQYHEEAWVDYQSQNTDNIGW